MPPPCWRGVGDRSRWLVGVVVLAVCTIFVQILLDDDLVYPSELPADQLLEGDRPECERPTSSNLLPIGQAVELLKTAEKAYAQGPNSGLCIRLSGNYAGGLANTVGLINVAMDFTVEEGIGFAFPLILPPDHEINRSFANLFGIQPECPKRKVLEHQAVCTCSNESRIPDRDAASQWISHRNGRPSCTPSAHYINMTPVVVRGSTICGCSRLIVMQTWKMRWHFNYSRTGETFFRRHLSANAGEPAPLELPKFHTYLIAVHVRLGDVGRKGLCSCKGHFHAEKYVCPAFYSRVLWALSSLVAQDCGFIAIITDGYQGDPYIRSLVKRITADGWREPAILDTMTPVRKAFSVMARADVLICGGSGFSRLAAVVAPRTNARIVARINSHPLADLANTTELPLNLHCSLSLGPTDIIAALVNNTAIQALAAKGCGGDEASAPPAASPKKAVP